MTLFVTYNRISALILSLFVTHEPMRKRRNGVLTVNSKPDSSQKKSEKRRYVCIWSYISMQPLYNKLGMIQCTIAGF